MLDNNIQNNTQNENEKVVQNGIQNVHQKFTARQNELRLYIINFTIDNKRPYNPAMRNKIFYFYLILHHLRILLFIHISPKFLKVIHLT